LRADARLDRGHEKMAAARWRAAAAGTVVAVPGVVILSSHSEQGRRLPDAQPIRPFATLGRLCV